MLVKGSLQLLGALVFLPALWLALLLPLLLILIGAGALLTDGYRIDAGQPPNGLISPVIQEIWEQATEIRARHPSAWGNNSGIPG